MSANINIIGSSLATTYRRTTSDPIDATSVWATYDDAEAYAANNGTEDYCPYAGQLVVTLAGYPGVSQSSDKYNKAHVWRLKLDSEDSRQHFTLDEVKSGDAVAGTDVHNIYTGTQRFGSWIELLAGMTMGFNLVTGTNPDTGEPIIETNPVTGKIQRYKDDGTIGDVQDNDERIWLDSQGHAHMVISAIKVLGKMEVHEIDVNHIKHTGGLFVNSRANLIVSDVTEQTGGYTKLSFVQRNADGMAIYNLFEAGDLALSMTFNVVKEGASQPTGDEVVRFYWREVDSIGTDSQSGTGYIILKPVPSAYQSYMSTPQVGDSVVQVGHVDAPSGSDEDTVNHVKSRQGLQCMGFSHTNGPYIAEYDGINSVAASVNFDRPDVAIVYLSPKYHKLQGDVILLKSGNQYIQLAEKLTAMAYDISLKANQASLELAEGQIEANARNITAKADKVALDAAVANIRAGNVRLVTIPASGSSPARVELQALNSDGSTMANLGGALIFDTNGAVQGVLNLSSGSVNYTDGFTLKAKNISFSASDAFDVTSPIFTVYTGKDGQGNNKAEKKALFRLADDGHSYLIIDYLDAKEILTEALTAGTNTFNAQGVTINNLTVGGNAVIGGTLDGCGGTFTGDISAASGAFGGSVVIKEGNTPKIKIDKTNIIDNDKTGSDAITHLAPNGLLVLVDQNQYVLVKNNGIEMRWGNDGVKLGSGGLKRYNGSAWVDMYAKPLTISINSTTILPANVQNVVCSGSGFDITLPSGADAGTQIMIKGTTSGGNYVSIYPPSGERISTTERSGVSYKNLYDDDCCWLTKLGTTWYWNYAEV